MISNRNVTKKHAVLTTQPFKLSFEFQKDRRKPPPKNKSFHYFMSGASFLLLHIML